MVEILGEKPACRKVLTKTIYMYQYHKYFMKMCVYIPIETKFKPMPVLPPGNKRIGLPVIGDNVYIGAGTEIIGSVKIGIKVLFL